MKQDVCLVGTRGWEHMYIFDKLSPRVRERLRESKHNVCVACVRDYAHRNSYYPEEYDFMMAIREMERMIERENVDVARWGIMNLSARI